MRWFGSAVCKACKDALVLHEITLRTDSRLGVSFFVDMHSYSLHFIIAISLATMLACFFSHSQRMRLISIGAVPILSYILFYNYNYGIINSVFPIIESYVGATYVCLLFLSLSSIREVSFSSPALNKILPKIGLLFFLEYLCILYVTVIPWAIDTFPLSNVEAVLFTLFAGVNDGAEEFVTVSLVHNALVPSIQIFLVVVLVQVTFAIALCRTNKTYAFVLWKKKNHIFSGRFQIRLFCLQKCVTIFLIIYCVILSLILPGIVTSAPFKALFQIPVDSELYRNHYVTPDSLNLEFPESPKNLIVILVESMETNFSHYTPEIVKIQDENTNFSPGGVTVAGTSWTIAGITSKLCGIPLNMPMGIDEYKGKLPTYLPYAKCLMDVLEEMDYNQFFLQGSSGEFTQKRMFWTAHGNVAVHDIEYYKRKGDIPEDYNVFWGFEDRKLYHFAKREITEISAKDKPFALYMLTVDTHLSDGYVDEQCMKELVDVEGLYPKALRCASKQLEEFVTWAKSQSWYANTVISVMGDHSTPFLSPKANVPLSDSLYWTNFVVNSSIMEPARNHQYSSLDIFPTLLESMGFKLKDRGAGLGRSLYSDSLTMLELYGRKKLDSLLRERSVQYDKFLLGK